MNTQHPPICDYEGSDYQTTFWDHGGREYEDRVEAVALRRLLPPSGDLLLELGAGAGRNTHRYHNFKRIVLLDYSLSQLKHAQDHLGLIDRYIYVAADIYRLPFVPGLFDCATMIRTLHHMTDPPHALAQVRRVMQSGGTFVLEYASKLHLKSIIRFALHRQTWNPFSAEAVEFAELNFNFHPKTIRTWLSNNHFKLERQLTVSHFRIKEAKRMIPLRLLVAMDSLAQLTGDLWQLTPSVFTRSSAIGKSPIPSSTHLFQCPSCGHHPLEETSTSLNCPSCLSRWPIQNGIYDFRKFK